MRFYDATISDPEAEEDGIANRYNAPTVREAFACEYHQPRMGYEHTGVQDRMLDAIRKATPQQAADWLAGVADGCRRRTADLHQDPGLSRGRPMPWIAVDRTPYPRALAALALAARPDDPYAGIVGAAGSGRDHGAEALIRLAEDGHRPANADALLFAMCTGEKEAVAALSDISPPLRLSPEMLAAVRKDHVGSSVYVRTANLGRIASDHNARTDVRVVAWLLAVDAGGDLPKAGCPPIAEKLRPAVEACVGDLTARHSDAALRILSAVSAAPAADTRRDNLAHRVSAVRTALMADGYAADPVHQQRALADHDIALTHDRFRREWVASRDGAIVPVRALRDVPGQTLPVATTRVSDPTHLAIEARADAARAEAASAFRVAAAHRPMDAQPSRPTPTPAPAVTSRPSAPIRGMGR